MDRTLPQLEKELRFLLKSCSSLLLLPPARPAIARRKLSKSSRKFITSMASSSAPHSLPYSDRHVTISFTSSSPTLTSTTSTSSSSFSQSHSPPPNPSALQTAVSPTVPVWVAFKIWRLGLGKIWWALSARARGGIFPKAEFRKNCWVCKRVGEGIEVGFGTEDLVRFWLAVTHG